MSSLPNHWHYTHLVCSFSIFKNHLWIYDDVLLNLWYLLQPYWIQHFIIFFFWWDLNKPVKKNWSSHVLCSLVHHSYPLIKTRLLPCTLVMQMLKSNLATTKHTSFKNKTYVNIWYAKIMMINIVWVFFWPNNKTHFHLWFSVYSLPLV